MPSLACNRLATACRTPKLPNRLKNCITCCHLKPREVCSSNPATAPQPRTRSSSMIRSLAAAVELNGLVQRYETFAGRSAMVGVAAAVCIELITDRSIFVPLNHDTAFTYGFVALTTLGTAVGVAFARGRSDSSSAPTGIDILEAVYASLTAVKRSAASVTQAQVDKAVDYVLETVLEGRFDSFSIEGLMLTSEDEL